MSRFTSGFQPNVTRQTLFKQREHLVVLCGQAFPLKLGSQRHFFKAKLVFSCFHGSFWMHRAEHCSTGGVTEGTWICRGRLALMVYSSSLVGFSLHISTSSRSMSPLISRPLANRPTRVTPHSTGMPSGLRADGWQPASDSLTAIQTHKYSQRPGPLDLTAVNSISYF